MEYATPFIVDGKLLDDIFHYIDLIKGSTQWADMVAILVEENTLIFSFIF